VASNVELQTQTQENFPAVASSPLLNREAVEAANRWLARFSPVLDGTDTLGADQTRQRVQLISDLRPDGQSALQNLLAQATQSDTELVATLRSSLNELDALETDLRRRLAALSPGDPAGVVDLGALQAKLAEKAAEREVSSWAPGDTLVTPTLELKTSPPNWGAALFSGLFSLGWTSFTTIHAFFFIGGFWHVMGPFALLFLLFYSIFWAVGLAMGAAAVLSACSESISLDGRRLTVRRSLFGFEWKRDYTIPVGNRARVTAAATRAPSENTPAFNGMVVAIRDEAGREIKLASGRPSDEQHRLVTKLNEYLGVPS
jgi:hypothetical protein